VRRRPGARGGRAGLAVVVALVAAGCGEAGEEGSRGEGPQGGPSAPGPGEMGVVNGLDETIPPPPIGPAPAPLRTLRAGTGPLPERYGFGRGADSATIERLDIDVLPDGTGLPPGRGAVAEGARVYRNRCAACHGVTGTEGPFARLVSPPGERSFPSSLERSPPTTIGNYWPSAPSLYEYVARAMPMQAPGTLSSDQVYAVVAWLLHRNGIVEEDAVLDRESLAGVEMPAQGRFIVDDRRGGSELR